jgi:hypothetical protein
VQVCPTGIDIRDGLQNECIGCAACIDVCNDVMDKMGYAQGLIRYSTENGVAGGWTRLQMFKRALRPRVLIYAPCCPSRQVAFTASVALRSPSSSTSSRTVARWPASSATARRKRLPAADHEPHRSAPDLPGFGVAASKAWWCRPSPPVPARPPWLR